MRRVSAAHPMEAKARRTLSEVLLDELVRVEQVAHALAVLVRAPPVAIVKDGRAEDEDARVDDDGEPEERARDVERGVRQVRAHARERRLAAWTRRRR